MTSPQIPIATNRRERSVPVTIEGQTAAKLPEYNPGDDKAPEPNYDIMLAGEE